MMPEDVFLTLPILEQVRYAVSVGAPYMGVPANELAHRLQRPGLIEMRRYGRTRLMDVVDCQTRIPATGCRHE